jgi:uroporphyrinogen decarboxylase
MTQRERVIAALRGDPVDRIPWCTWYHFRLKPPAGPESRMAEAELQFFRQFQPDIFKVMHDVEYEPIPPLESPADWRKLQPLDPTKGNFGMQLHTLRQIRAGVGPDVPVIDTVFNAFYYADHLAPGKLREHLAADPDAVMTGVRAIADSLAAYARACVETSCDGIYFAVSGASAEGLSREEYARWFLPLDKQVLETVKSAPVNIVHLHGYKDLHFAELHDLPAAAVCWSDRAAGPSLVEARKIHAGCLMGGVDEQQFEKMTPAEIEAQARESIREMRGTPFILASGCSVPDNSAPERILAIAAATR